MALRVEKFQKRNRRLRKQKKGSERKMSNESNIENHSENEFKAIVEHGLKSGIHIIASKNHGKSRLLFSMARALRQKARDLIFDGSEAWLYGFDKIPTFTVNENDIQLVSENHTIEDIERYGLTNWHLIELALKTHKDILFRLKTRKPSKRGFFIRTVINYLDAIQRESRQSTTDNEAKGYISYFIEESQDAFNPRSTTRLEAEEFLTVFNEARNQKEAFYTASQRLTDFSKAIRTKQVYCIGKIPEEDKAIGIRRLEKNHNIDFAKLEPRTWFFEGKTFKSPEWKQKGKPFIINKEIKKAYVQSLPQPKKPQTTISKIKEFFTKPPFAELLKNAKKPQKETIEELDKEFEEEDSEDLLDEDWLNLEDE